MQANRFALRVGCRASRNPRPSARLAVGSDRFLAKPFDFRDLADVPKDRERNR